MDDRSIGRNVNDYQLIKIGIDLAHKVMELSDNSDLLMNPRVHKASELAKKWHQEFIKLYTQGGE
jgi:hypothetical protein